MYTYNESGNEMSGKWDEYEIGCLGYENLDTWYEIRCSGYEMLVLGMKWKHNMKQKKISQGMKFLSKGMKKVFQVWIWGYEKSHSVWKKVVRYEKKFKGMKKTF
jgi:hypothetical protein